jgi:hypothetical protein
VASVSVSAAGSQTLFESATASCAASVTVSGVATSFGAAVAASTVTVFVSAVTYPAIDLRFVVGTIYTSWTAKGNYVTDWRGRGNYTSWTAQGVRV